MVQRRLNGLRTQTLSSDSTSSATHTLVLAVHVALVDWSCHLSMCLCPHLVHLSTRYLLMPEILSSFNFTVRSDLPGVPDASRSGIIALVNVGVCEVQESRVIL